MIKDSCSIHHTSTDIIYFINFFSYLISHLYFILYFGLFLKDVKSVVTDEDTSFFI